MIGKVCPLVLHPGGAPLRFLAFTHPITGAQIVKGTIEPGEHPTRAAARELWEESGLTAISALELSVREDIWPGERWHFILTRVRGPVPDRFQHFCRDDGGHLFKFWWHDLEDEGAFEPPFDTVIDAARAALTDASG
ncbi:MAG: NUDIX domain-containing protein [Pseudomonadota bacterium]